MRTKSRILALVSALAILVAQSTQANIMFEFTEVGNTVTMTSSGVLDTSKLVSVSRPDGWGGIGTEHNGNPGDIDIMGSTLNGPIDVQFGFNAGTDFSAITNPGGPFSSSNFTPTLSSGGRSFTTYSGFDNGFRLPGIGIVASDIVNSLWTPDQNWTYGLGDTFASLGLNVGVWAVSDSVTNETITIKIGNARVPDSGVTFAMLGLALTGLAVLRRNRKLA